MIIIRSTLFNIVFYINLILQMIIFTPFYFLASQKNAWFVPKFWSRSSHWLMDKIVGTTFSIEGLENIPEGGYILAPKHQSFWDTYALMSYLKQPIYIVKRELMWVPLFGLYLKKVAMIPVDRNAKGKAMAEVMARTKEALHNDRQLLIYPEGTRRSPGDTPHYRNGIVRLYESTGVPVVPVVMHPGLFWPRRKFLRYPGHFRVVVLPPIMPGLTPAEFKKKLITSMEVESDKLLVDTIENNPDLPLPDTAKKRYAELKEAGL